MITFTQIALVFIAIQLLQSSLTDISNAGAEKPPSIRLFVFGLIQLALGSAAIYGAFQL